jgi:hypothetical protein
MVIHSGDFYQHISTVFPKLHSLKMTARTPISVTIIKNCPQLVQLSIVSREPGSESIINNWVIEILAFYESTLQNLQLIQNPIRSVDRSVSFEILGKETISALAFCENLKFLEISGFVYISEQGSRVLGKGHPELEAVVQNSTGICRREREVCVRLRDLRVTCCLVNQVLISNAEHFEVSSHTWARTCKTS